VKKLRNPLVAHDAQGIEKNDDAVGNKVIVFCEFKEMQRMLRHYIEMDSASRRISQWGHLHVDKEQRQ